MFGCLIKQHKEKTVVTVQKDGEIVHKVDLIKGKEYIINPINPRVTKNRGRKVIFCDVQRDRFGVYAKVKYLDTNRPGKVEIDYIGNLF